MDISTSDGLPSDVRSGQGFTHAHIASGCSHENRRLPGYTIKSFPQQGRKLDEWTINLEIFWEHHGTPMTQSFTADTHYASEEEADLHGITYGQRIMMGKSRDWR